MRTILQLFVFISLLFATPLAAAISLDGPAQTELTLVFKANMTYKWGFVLSGSPRMSAHLEGDLLPYAELRDRQPDGPERILTVALTIPPTLPAGSHSLALNVRDLTQDGVVESKNISVWVPYRKPNITIASVTAEDVVSGENATTVLLLQSLTDLDVPATQEYALVDYAGDVRARFQGEPFTIPSRSTHKTFATFNVGNLTPQYYTLLVWVGYEKTFANASGLLLVKPRPVPKMLNITATPPSHRRLPPPDQKNTTACPYLDCPETCAWTINFDEKGCSACVCPPGLNETMNLSCEGCACTSTCETGTIPKGFWTQFKAWISRVWD